MRPLRVLQRGSHGVSPTESASLFLGTQVDERTILDPTDTVIDPVICAKGGWIDLPKGMYYDHSMHEVRSVYYPAFGHQQQGRIITLNQMAVAANRLLRVIRAFEEGTAEAETVQKAVASYQFEAVRQLGGKKGLLNSNVIASRVKNSARAVIVPHGSRSPEWIGVPSEVMTRLHLEDGDLVILGREPTIWGGSIEVLRAKTGRSNCFEVHPLIFKQLGADADGDTVWLYKVSKTEECQKEAEQNILGFAKTFSKWPVYLRMTDESETVSWDTVHEDTRQRAKVTGFSVSPREILDNAPRLQHLCKVMGKDVSAECIEIAKGLSPERYKQEIERQNVALVNMKMGMGPIGAAANKLRLFASTDLELLESASYVSERLQQILLDTKHWIGRKDGYSVQDAVDMLNRRAQFKNIHKDDAVGVLVKMGMDEQKVRPIMHWLWVQYPVWAAVKRAYKDLSQSRLFRMYGYIRTFDTSSARQVLEKIRMVGKAVANIEPKTIMEASKAFQIGVTDICEAEFPLAVLMSDATLKDRPKAMKVADAVFNGGIRDSHGLTRIALEEALNVRS